ncbi:MAG: FemAB family PEP-CTERM system-associated protein [candidate division Zixibacteria bacterium]|nr:FemAB family PEP-CTERM system-associated protein [candidate division Zixibacteria bacterium]
MEITQYSETDCADWESYADSRSSCWHYHKIGWKEVIESAYRHQCRYLIARDNGAIAGILPIAVVKSRLFGHSLTSLPFLDYAGLVADTPSARDALVAHACRITDETRAHYLELRQIESVGDQFHTAGHKVTLVLDLPDDPEQLLNSLPPERRNRIRKARKSELTVEIHDRSMLPTFYRIWTENMRDLGSPPHSLSFFDAILRVFPDSAGVLLVKYRHEYIGAAICLYTKDMLTLPWVSSRRQFFELYPNNILYWEAMCFAIRQGCRRFDFGRSSIGSGTHTFKIRWGAKEVPLYWQFYTPAGQPLPLPAGDNPKYRLALATWKRLPVTITRLVGPSIRKYITA